MVLNLNKYDAVIFDLDGTIIDSMWMWHAIDVEYLGGFGIEIPEDLQRCIEGKSFTETAIYFKERFNIPDDVETIKDNWHRMSMEMYSTRVDLKPGVYDFIKEIYDNKIKLAIATSNSKELTAAVLKARGIDEFFQAVITGSDVIKGKPNPDIYLKAAEQLQVCPEKCLVIEDVPQGIIAGKNAGMEVCAVYDKYSVDVDEKKHLLSDYYIESYEDITYDK